VPTDHAIYKHAVHAQAQIASRRFVRYQSENGSFRTISLKRCDSLRAGRCADVPASLPDSELRQVHVAASSESSPLAGIWKSTTFDLRGGERFYWLLNTWLCPPRVVPHNRIRHGAHASAHSSFALSSRLTTEVDISPETYMCRRLHKGPEQKALPSWLAL
jgi:hypothetical protein